jgi:putative DNA primase/helicase
MTTRYDHADGDTVDDDPFRSSMRTNEGVDDPHRLARMFLQQHHQHPDRPTLVFWRGEWFAWSGSMYGQIPADELRATLNSSIKVEFDRVNEAEVRDHQPRSDKAPPMVRKVTRSLVGNVADALGSLVTIPARVDQPSWLGAGNAPFDPRRAIFTPTQIIDLEGRFQGRTDWCHPQTPKLFAGSTLGCDFDPHAPSPMEWLKFLKSIWPNDPEAIALLRQWFGYCLTCDTSQQKILLLVGPKRSGKGTIVRILDALLGPDSVTSPTLGSLASPFGLWPLVGKSLATISDARLSGRIDHTAIIERLLSISGEDRVTVDRKNLSTVDVRLSTRFIIATNEIPKLPDASGAITSRFLVLVMRESFYGREDKRLEGRLKLQLPSILKWAIEGWQELRGSGSFVQPASGLEAIEEMENLGSPESAFVRERCQTRPGATASPDELFDAWKDWCKENGREHPGTLQTFCRNLRASVPGLRLKQQRIGGDHRKRCYEGIELVREHPDFDLVSRDGTRSSGLY